MFPSCHYDIILFNVTLVGMWSAVHRANIVEAVVWQQRWPDGAVEFHWTVEVNSSHLSYGVLPLEYS